jgi:hypothetical protein
VQRRLGSHSDNLCYNLAGAPGMRDMNRGLKIRKLEQQKQEQQQVPRREEELRPRRVRRA